MARTLELGRVLIASAERGLQLWSTTVITLSPLQNSFDIQAVDYSSLIQLLHSGCVWVCRGNGLHLDIKLTNQGEKFRAVELDQLTENLLKAPVWTQLGLHASLPSHSLEDELCSFDHGCIRINLDYTHGDVEEPVPRHHRIFSDVPFVDIRPPDGIITFALHSVQMEMDVRKYKQRPRKALRPNPIGPREYAPAKSPARIQPEYQKQHSEQTHACAKAIQSEFTMHTDDKEALVDSALRISIYDTTPKLATGLKVIAKDFSGSLASICPAIWSPGYLQASAQRANLMPNISRSLINTVSPKGISSSLQAKLLGLRHNQTVDQPDLSCSSLHEDSCPNRPPPDTILPKLWTHTHDRMQRISKLPLKRFIDSSSPLELDNMLDGPAKLLRPNCKSNQNLKETSALRGSSYADHTDALTNNRLQQQVYDWIEPMGLTPSKRPFPHGQLGHTSELSSRVKIGADSSNEDDLLFNRNSIVEQPTAEEKDGFKVLSQE